MERLIELHYLKSPIMIARKLYASKNFNYSKAFRVES